MILWSEQPCRELGGDYFDRLHPERTAKRLVERLERLGPESGWSIANLPILWAITGSVFEGNRYFGGVYCSRPPCPNWGGSGDAPCIAMEYVEGRSLEERIGRKGLPLMEALHIAVQVAGALATAHDQGILSRDLKPGIVMAYLQRQREREMAGL